MRVTLVIKKPVTIEGETYSPGHVATNIALDTNIKELEADGAVEIHNPQWDCTKRVDGVSSRRIMWTGEHQTINHSTGFYYRCVDKAVSESVAESALSTMGGEFTEIDIPGVYVPPATTITNHDKHIAAFMPDSPNILIVRDEGIGDILMSIPTVRELRRKYPKATITYATLPKNFEVLYDLDCVDYIVSVHGLDLSRASGWDLVINWCHAIENYNTPRNRGLRIDSFSRHIGLTLTDRRMEYRLLQSDVETANIFLSEVRGQRPLIGYVVKSVSWQRTYPIWLIPKVVAAITDKFGDDAMVVLIDNSKNLAELYPDGDNLLNLCGKTRSLGVASAVMAQCDVVITPDTGAVHICGALGIPQVVLFGSIPAKARISDETHPGAVAIEGRAWCSPCWSWQADMSDAERAEHPSAGIKRNCRYTGTNVCLEAITPQDIANAAEIAMSRALAVCGEAVA